jgi:hypothetical protein
MQFLQTWRFLFVILTGILITLWPAFYNQYVFFFTDSEVYINCGNTFSTIEDRSFIYGFFVSISSLFTSLWFTIIAQAILFNSVFYVFLKKITANQFHNKLYLSITAILSIFTALGWDVCYIMPDIFSSISILLLYLLVFHFPKKQVAMGLLILSYILCAQMHFSYMLAHLLVVGLLLLLRLFNPAFMRALGLKHLVLIFCITLGNMGLFRIEKQTLGGGHSFSNASYVFLMGKLVENGVLKRYLDQECATKAYEICAYKDSLSLNNLSGTFLWVPTSAFNRTGGWNANHDEYKTIIKDIVTTPKYSIHYACQVAIETAKSLGHYRIFSSFYPFPRDGWGPHPAVVKYYPNEISRYDHSRQNMDTLSFPLEKISYVYLSLLIASLLLVVWFCRNNLITTLYLLFALISNALITAGLTGIHDRYATRQDWLVIVLAIVLICKPTRLKKQEDSSQSR